MNSQDVWECRHNWANCHRKRVGGGWLSVSTCPVFRSMTLIHSDDPYWCKNNWANCHRKRGYGDGSAWVQRIVTDR